MTPSDTQVESSGLTIFPPKYISKGSWASPTMLILEDNSLGFQRAPFHVVFISPFLEDLKDPFKFFLVLLGGHSLDNADIISICHIFNSHTVQDGSQGLDIQEPEAWS